MHTPFGLIRGGQTNVRADFVLQKGFLMSGLQCFDSVGVLTQPIKVSPKMLLCVGVFASSAQRVPA